MRPHSARERSWPAFCKTCSANKALCLIAEQILIFSIDTAFRKVIARKIAIFRMFVALALIPRHAYGEWSIRRAGGESPLCCRSLTLRVGCSTRRPDSESQATEEGLSPPA